VVRLLSERKGSLTVILITHAREMMEIAERVVMLEQGRVVEEGPWEVVSRRTEGPLANLLRGGVWVGNGGAGYVEGGGGGKRYDQGKGKGKERVGRDVWDE